LRFGICEGQASTLRKKADAEFGASVPAKITNLRKVSADPVQHCALKSAIALLFPCWMTGKFLPCFLRFIVNKTLQSSASLHAEGNAKAGS